ncbi:hypothetical protein HCH_04563 [Hahella chejuensis KCTC 2396]|uniref:Holin of 3TMs, for gene-transfer release n=1 Tax=Hahella chejuensis (strain KCTC 2396) TaxID=349521 RepID=Q2SDK9_HAHCH|nr:hypothetical protein HCH_04563 [Hahella chejuensis KCTC 2396]
MGRRLQRLFRWTSLPTALERIPVSAWTSILNLFKPVADLIDNVHTSDEERLQVQAQLFQIQAELTQRVMEYETKLLEAKARTIQAEAQGQSILQRNWRPLTMLCFLALVVCDSFGLLTFRLSVEAWDLLQIGLGGYVAGRSLEKIAPKVTDVMSKK